MPPKKRRGVKSKKKEDTVENQDSFNVEESPPSSPISVKSNLEEENDAASSVRRSRRKQNVGLENLKQKEFSPSSSSPSLRRTRRSLMHFNESVEISPEKNESQESTDIDSKAESTDDNECTNKEDTENFEEKENLEETAEEKESLELTVEEKESLELTVEEKNGLELIVEERESLELTVEERESLELTVEEKESLELTLEEKESLELTVEEIESLEKTVEEESFEETEPMEVDCKTHIVDSDSASLVEQIVESETEMIKKIKKCTVNLVSLPDKAVATEVEEPTSLENCKMDMQEGKLKVKLHKGLSEGKHEEHSLSVLSDEEVKNSFIEPSAEMEIENTESEETSEIHNADKNLAGNIATEADSQKNSKDIDMVSVEEGNAVVKMDTSAEVSKESVSENAMASKEEIEKPTLETINENIISATSGDECQKESLSNSESCQESNTSSADIPAIHSNKILTETSHKIKSSVLYSDLDPVNNLSNRDESIKNEKEFKNKNSTSSDILVINLTEDDEFEELKGNASDTKSKTEIDKNVKPVATSKTENKNAKPSTTSKKEINVNGTPKPETTPAPPSKTEAGSDSQKNKIPGRAFIIGTRGAGEDGKKTLFDCVLCFSGEEKYGVVGAMLNKHIKTKEHALKVMEVESQSLYNKFKDDPNAKAEVIINAILGHEETQKRQALVLASKENYLSQRQFLVKKITLLKECDAKPDNTEEVMSGTTKTLSKPPSKKKTLTTAPVNTEKVKVPLALNTLNFLSLFKKNDTQNEKEEEMDSKETAVKYSPETLSDQLAEKQKGRLPDKIVFVMDDRDVFLCTEKLGDFVRIIRKRDLDFAKAVDFVKSDIWFGKGTLYMFLGGVFSSIKVRKHSTCSQYKCEIPVRIYHIEKDTQSNIIINEALQLHKEILDSTTNDQALFYDLLPINVDNHNILRIDKRLCYSTHPIDFYKKVPSQFIELYTAALNEFNQFVEKHTLNLGYKFGSLVRATFGKPVYDVTSVFGNIATDGVTLNETDYKRRCSTILTIAKTMRKQLHSEIIKNNPSLKNAYEDPNEKSNRQFDKVAIICNSYYKETLTPFASEKVVIFADDDLKFEGFEKFFFGEEEITSREDSLAHTNWKLLYIRD